MNIKKTILGVVTALSVSCQPAMADVNKNLNSDAFFCEHDFVLRTVESNLMKGMSMSNDRYFSSGICKLFPEDTSVELDSWPIIGDDLRMLNVRINGVVYVTRKFYMEKKLEKGE